MKRANKPIIQATDYLMKNNNSYNSLFPDKRKVWLKTKKKYGIYF